MRLYLAGPMRGFRDDNRAAFDEASAALRTAGHEVIVPYELDRKFPGRTLREKFAGSVSWLCQHAEAVALLDSWEHSSGAQAEVACAQALGIPAQGWRCYL